MLQPLQLKEVSARYPQQIAEVRDFLVKADCMPGRADSLQAIASRVQQDRGFHRDLTSYLWVVIHMSQRTISFADLFGVLAIAAAGEHFAAEAQEEDAHALLRFVMEARQSLEGAARRESAPVVAAPVFVAPAVPVAAPLRVVQPQGVREPEMLPLRGRPVPMEAPAFEVEEDEGSRKRFVWIGAAVAGAALAVGLLMHARTPPEEVVAPSPTVAVDAPAPGASEGTAVAGARSEAPVVQAGSASPRRSTREIPHAEPDRNAYKPSATRSFVPTHSSPTPPVVASSAPLKPAPAASSYHPAPAAPYRASPAPAPVVRNSAAGPSSVSLGGTVNTADADPANSGRGSSAPRLLRRTPPATAPLVADNRPPPVVASSGPHGTVHAVTLGSSASSVLYSPTPAYPAAASAAHVQGEVKLEANVDRQGNVASVRVISGPPMLREAAMDAAQHWRYRPNLAGGEATTMSAVTVFAFQLP